MGRSVKRFKIITAANYVEELLNGFKISSGQDTSDQSHCEVISEGLNNQHGLPHNYSEPIIF